MMALEERPTFAGDPMIRYMGTSYIELNGMYFQVARLKCRIDGWVGRDKQSNPMYIYSEIPLYSMHLTIR